MELDALVREFVVAHAHHDAVGLGR